MLVKFTLKSSRQGFYCLSGLYPHNRVSTKGKEKKKILGLCYGNIIYLFIYLLVYIIFIPRVYNYYFIFLIALAKTNPTDQTNWMIPQKCEKALWYFMCEKALWYFTVEIVGHAPKTVP